MENISCSEAIRKSFSRFERDCLIKVRVGTSQQQ
jgi:hypothetical protein